MVEGEVGLDADGGVGVDGEAIGFNCMVGEILCGSTGDDELE